MYIYERQVPNRAEMVEYFWKPDRPYAQANHDTESNAFVSIILVAQLIDAETFTCALNSLECFHLGACGRPWGPGGGRLHRLGPPLPPSWGTGAAGGGGG